MQPTHSPHIAIVSQNTLTAIGLRHTLQTMMPQVEITLFQEAAALKASTAHTVYFHYFVTTQALLSDIPFFSAARAKTVVLVTQENRGLLPMKYHSICTTQTEEALVRSLMAIQHHGHAGKNIPESAHPIERTAGHGRDAKLTLSPREKEVLRYVAMGRINKEIADELCIGLSTVISHRKNLSEKLGLKSVSALTIYAVVHGLLPLEQV